MGSGFRVTAAQLRIEAENLQNYDEQFKSKVAELEELEQSLNSQWEGQAHDAFHNAFTKDKGQMDNFYALIKTYVQALQEIAKKYEESEARNTQTATTRTY